MLATGEIRETQRPKAIASIERNAVALHELVDELLDVSQIVAGKVRLDFQQVAVGEVVAAAVDSLRPAAAAKDIRLTTNIESGDTVPGDARRLQQVVWNLLTNAVKFTGEGGRIDVTCRRIDDQVEIVVSDTGIGIDKDFLPYVFERFRQGRAGATRVHGGLGLGLSIVRDIVQMHGGTVVAENNDPPPGAMFRVMLPAAVAAPTYSGSDSEVWSGHAMPAISSSAPGPPKPVAG
jgi:signal transduction histidine kinase